MDMAVEAQQPKVPRYAWFDTVTMELVRTEEKLVEVIDQCIANGHYGIDVEATGLDNRVFEGKTKDQIAGIGLAPTTDAGYYVPCRHRKKLPDGSFDHETYVNIPLAVFRREFKRLAESDAIGVFHGGKYDHDMLQFEGSGDLGTWDRARKWEDTLLLAYLDDSRAKKRGLKTLSPKYLGLEMIELGELFHAMFGKDYKGPLDFSLLDPEWEPAIHYATSDVIITMRLYKYLHPRVHKPDDGMSQAFIYAIEKGCITATRWMRRNRIWIDQTVVRELIKVANKDCFDAFQEVYEAAGEILGRDITINYFKLLRGDYGKGSERFQFRADDVDVHIINQIDLAKEECKRLYPNPGKEEGSEYLPVYDISSNQQLGKLMLEMKVPGLRYTPTGMVMTSREEIDRITAEYGERFPFMKKVKRFRESRRALSNYLLPMQSDVDPHDGTGVINFNGQATDTGRFSTPTKSRVRVPGVLRLNLQALPATYDPDRPESMKRLRECIKPRPGGDIPRFIVAIDYSGVELRLVTNLSREPKWLAEFFRCGDCGKAFDQGDGTKTPEPPPAFCPLCGSDKIGDLHSLTGEQLFGKEARQQDGWKQKRQDAKRVNFGLCYGGGGNAVQTAIGCDKNEGNRIKRQFDKAYTGLKTWWDHQHKFGKKHGFVRTAFGRKYPVPDINLPRMDPQTGRKNSFFISKAKRNAVNGPIQGTSADVTKIAMALIYQEFKRRGWLDKARMIITMHDELVFEVDGDILEEFIEVTEKIMVANKPILKRQWPIPLTSDVEVGLSWTVPWDVTMCAAGKVRFVGNKKHKAKGKLPSGAVWEDMSSWPATLTPFFKKAGGGDQIAPTAKAETVEETPQTADTPEKPAPDSDDKAPKKGELSAGDVYVFRLIKPLLPETVVDLGKVIAKCKGGGTRILQIQTRSGRVLDGWSEDPVYVNDQKFYHLAQDRGLC